MSILVFDVSLVAMYAGSAALHLGTWRGRGFRAMLVLDHTNIFLLIAGTYTPIAVNVLSGWLRPSLLMLVWALAAAGIVQAIIRARSRHWSQLAMFLAMGWVSLAALPSLLAALPPAAIGTLVAGGLFYTAGAIIYAARRPNPFPRVFGYHEVFHLFVIAGSSAFLAAIWIWVVPFPRA